MSDRFRQYVLFSVFHSKLYNQIQNSTSNKV
jgi:hypothetical protein